MRIPRNSNSLTHKVLADVLSVENIAESTPYSKDWIRTQLRTGRLRGRKLGGRWVVLRTALLDFLRADPPSIRIVESGSTDARMDGDA